MKIDLCIKNIDAIIYYIGICEKNSLSKRQLQERIRNHEYDRLSDKTKNKLITKEQLYVNDLVPNPIIIKIVPIIKKLEEFINYSWYYHNFILCNFQIK